MYPTLLEIAGAAKPKHELDGESLVKVMKDPQATLSREAIYQHFPGYLGAGPGEWRTTPVGTIQMGDWKLMEFFEDGRLELYNLKDDLGERKNLAKDMPEKTQELRAKMVKWREAINAPMPTKNDQVKPVERRQRRQEEESCEVAPVSKGDCCLASTNCRAG